MGKPQFIYFGSLRVLCGEKSILVPATLVWDGGGRRGLVCRHRHAAADSADVPGWRSFMRALVQRADRAGVEVDGRIVGAIGRGMLVLLGVGHDDGAADADFMADKCVNLRIFEDAGGKMNLALPDIGGAMLVVSQFTLYGDARRGRRPSFSAAAAPAKAEELYRRFATAVAAAGVEVATGVFGASMKVELVNDGPVTIMLESPGAVRD